MKLVLKQDLLKVVNLKKYFPIRGGFFSKTVANVQAVNGVSFSLQKGETIGLVGESGCGKSTTGRLILRLIEKTEGEIYFENQDIYRLKRSQLQSLRRDMQIIFQDPYASLNPRMKVGNIISEPMRIHGIAPKEEIERRVSELLKKVGLQDQARNRYPHEFSGGQRQRIGIARALALNPKLIIADEPVSALDVSIQAQILNILTDLKKEFQLSYLIISHDLGVVAHMSDRVVVMYLGKVVEMATTEELYRNPVHPYTQALLSSIPVADPRNEKQNRKVLKGDVPSPIDPPSGCYFHPRCQYHKKECTLFEPEFETIGNNHVIACPVRAGGSFNDHQTQV